MSNAGTNNLFRKGNLALWIQHVNTGKMVSFKAFLTDFQENFDTAYDEQYFVMHPDPLRKWKSTVRSINLGWKIVAYDTKEAEHNLRQVSSLASFLYGEQEERFAGGVSFYSPKVGGSPIFRVKMVNLMTDTNLGSNAESGLLGYIDGFTYKMSMDQPFFSKEAEAQRDKGLIRNLFSSRGAAGGASVIYPQLIEASFKFYPVHEKTPAWINGNFSIGRFPYGINPASTRPSGRRDERTEVEPDNPSTTPADEVGRGTDPAEGVVADTTAAATEARVMQQLKQQNPNLD